MKYNLINAEKYYFTFSWSIFLFPFGTSLKTWQIIQLKKKKNHKKIHRRIKEMFSRNKGFFLYSGQISICWWGNGVQQDREASCQRLGFCFKYKDELWIAASDLMVTSHQELEVRKAKHCREYVLFCGIQLYTVWQQGSETPTRWPGCSERPVPKETSATIPPVGRRGVLSPGLTLTWSSGFPGATGRRAVIFRVPKILTEP